MLEEQCREIIALSLGPNWGSLVQVLDKDIDRSIMELGNPDSPRDADQFLKGFVFACRNVKKLPEMAERKLKELTDPQDEG